MIKKFLFVAAFLIIAASAALFIYRYYIIQHTAEKIIRNALPDYVQIETIRLEPERRALVLENFRIVNPDGFSDRYLLEIEKITTGYRPKGRTLLDGIEILEPEFTRPVLIVERLPGGKTNLQAMGEKVSG